MLSLSKEVEQELIQARALPLLSLFKFTSCWSCLFRILKAGRTIKMSLTDQGAAETAKKFKRGVKRKTFRFIFIVLPDLAASC